MKNESKIVIYSILTGIIITLITGLFPNIFLFGVSYRGYLLPWLMQVVYPAPLEIIWLYLIVDVIIWSVLVYLALLSVIEEKQVKRKPKRRR